MERKREETTFGPQIKSAMLSWYSPQQNKTVVSTRYVARPQTIWLGSFPTVVTF